MIIKIIITLFLVYALSRVYLRYRDGSLSIFSLIFWFLLWLLVGFFVWWPNFSTFIANIVGVGRGVDILIYISIIFLFFAIFRIYIKIEYLEREITEIVRKIAIEKENKEEIKNR